jgi:hypothetical protein
VTRVLKEVAEEKKVDYEDVRKIFKRVGAKRGIY